MKTRFINLNLFTLAFPFTAIISFLHRLSGVFIFLLIPLFIWIFDLALNGETGFTTIKSTLSHGSFRFLLWFTLASLGYHLFAGIRHIIMDLGWGEELHHARFTALLVMVISLIWALILGMWLW